MTARTRPEPSHLDVEIHQLVLLEDVVDLPRLQPGICLFLLLLQVDEYPQTALGVLQSGFVGPGIRCGRSEQVSQAGRPRGVDGALPRAVW